MTAGRRPVRDDEVPDADLQEQSIDVVDLIDDVDDDERVPPVPEVEIPPEVPEADAIEQAIPVATADEDDWR